MNPYDFFISYSRPDLDWVVEHLYLPLRSRRMRNAREPRVFFDKDVIESGHAWRQNLADAIEHCRHFIAVYSDSYFQSDFCQWELNLAATRDPLAKNRILLPVRMGECDIPFAYQPIHYADTTSPGWFEQLCMQLGVGPAVAEQLNPDATGKPALVEDYLYRDLVAELRALTDDGPSAFEVRVDVYSSVEPAPRVTRDIALVPRRTRTAFRLGDTLRLRVLVEEVCHVYVIDIGTTGKIRLLYPNRFTPDSRVRPESPRILPAESDPYELTLTGDPGTEVVQVFALDRPLENARDAEPLPDSFEPIAVPRLTRDIQIISHAAARSEAPLRAAFAQVEFEVAVGS